jgi:hypothetical protein
VKNNKAEMQSDRVGHYFRNGVQRRPPDQVTFKQGLYGSDALSIHLNKQMEVAYTVSS